MKLKNWSKIIKDEEHGDVLNFLEGTRKHYIQDMGNSYLEYYKRYNPKKYRENIQRQIGYNSKLASKKPSIS